ncbi:MAG: hypothetical protein HYV93_24565 [Candidatus Rokubacteria bacterium]|nr:hypothetical protein [Candidatus Rokubacteria bacterium]
MTGRFAVDLLHPGRVAVTWQEWFVGVQGRRRLGFFILGAAGVLLLVLVGGILPTYWRLSADLTAIPRLQKDLAAADADLGLLRTNLQALAAEARRQVRWAELMTAFSQQTPPTLKIQSLESARVAPPPAAGQPAQEVRSESLLRIEAITPLRPGSPPLLEVAQFMAGLMRDPVVSRRFQLRSWEIKPPGGGATDPLQFLSISIVLAERPS